MAKKKKSISKSTASKSYNKKTIAKMNARDAAKSSSSSSSSSSRSQQIADIAKQAQAIQNSLNSSIASGQIKSGGGSSSSTSKPTSTPNYNYDSTKETASQYNARIAAERGDTASQLQAMQAATQKQADSGKVYNSSTVADTLGRAQSVLDQTKAQGDTPYAGSTYEQSYVPPVAPPVQPAVVPPPVAPVPTTPLPTAPVPTTTPITASVDTTDQFYTDLVNSMKPTGEENNLTSQESALDAQLRNLNQGQGVMNQNIADQPIALPFVTGQQTAVENRYALQRGDVNNRKQTLQEKLANLQKKRQSSIDVARIGLERAQGKDAATRAYEKAQREQQQYNDQLKQQQYENTTGASRYQDQLTQQQFDNKISQQNANRLLNNTTNSGDKEQEKLATNVKEGLSELMKGATWGSVWNRLYSQYRTGDAAQDAALSQYLDQTLDKNTWAKAGAYQQFKAGGGREA